MSDEPGPLALLERMRLMKPSDISILEDIVAKKAVGSGVGTSPGTANDGLWSEMEKLGWVTVENHSYSLPSGNALVTRTFKVVETGLAPLSDLIRAYSSQSS
jgi:hypothetical protein